MYAIDKRVPAVAIPPAEGQAMATGNMLRKFGDCWTCGFGDMLEDGETHKPTDPPTNRHAHHNTALSYRRRSNQLTATVRSGGGSIDKRAPAVAAGA